MTDYLDLQLQEEMARGDNTPIPAPFIPEFTVDIDNLPECNIVNLDVISDMETQLREAHAELRIIFIENGTRYAQSFDSIDEAWELFKSEDIQIKHAEWNSQYAEQNLAMLHKWQLENTLQARRVVELTFDRWTGEFWTYNAAKRFLTVSGAGAFANDTFIRVTRIREVLDVEMHRSVLQQKRNRFPKGKWPKGAYRFG